MLEKLRRRRRRWSIEVTERGFLLVGDNPREVLREVDWSEIQNVIAYKKDAVSVDMICFAIATGDGSAVEIHEEMIGWDTLVETLPKNLLGFPNGEQWFAAVAFPAFATNVTTLYQRSGA